MSGRDLTTRPQCTIHARGQICHFLCFPEPKREVRKSVMGHKSDCVATPYHPRGGETGGYNKEESLVLDLHSKLSRKLTCLFQAN